MDEPKTQTDPEVERVRTELAGKTVPAGPTPGPEPEWIVVNGARIGTLGRWSGLPLYRCRWCVVADLDRDRLIKHVSTAHAAEAAKAKAEEELTHGKN